MCQALPKRVIKIEKYKATVEDSSGHLEVNLLDDKIKIGDFVLVYGNLAINKISKKEAGQIMKDLKSEAR